MYLEEKDLKALIPSETEIEKLFDELWPICRSLTGNGVKDSFKILQKNIPLDIVNTPSGTEVFDWKIPQEWNIHDAYVIDPSGKKIIDFKENNLHIVNCSIPFRGTVSLEELQAHLYSLPEQPNAIPYVTSYYRPQWGFCLEHSKREKLKNGNYQVVIDSTLRDGHLTYGHLVLPSTEGRKEEVILSTYICHPSMANNELSGPIVTSYIYSALSKIKKRKFNYRFIFIPETIGAITYLHQHGDHLKENCVGGLVVTCCGDDKAINYKKSKNGNSVIDKIAINIVSHSKLSNIKIKDFFPTGSDERQYNSPGFNLNVGSITRSMYAEYPEYHTSLDNKNFISFKAFQDTIAVYLKTLIVLDSNDYFINQSPYGEPMLGKRGLYSAIGGSKNLEIQQKSLLYLLTYSDGQHDLVDIANKMNISAYDILPFLDKLIEVNLLSKKI